MVENNNNEEREKLEAERKRLFDEMMATVNKQNEMYGPDGEYARKRQEEDEKRAKRQQEVETETLTIIKKYALISVIAAIPFYLAGKDILAIAIVILGCIVAIAIGFSHSSSEENKDTKKALRDANFDAFKSVRATGEGGDATIVANRSGGLCLVRSGKVENYFQIGHVEIDFAGHSETKTNTGSQVGRAIVGGALAGGVGLVIGGLSGSKKTSEIVNTIALRFTLNGQSYEIVFLNTETTKGSSLYDNALKEARYWQSLLKRGKS
jgi:hypothetical protein